MHQSFGVGRTGKTSTNLQFLDRLETRQAIRHAIHPLSPGLVRFVRLRYGCYWRHLLVQWRSPSFAFALRVGRCLPKLELKQNLKRSRVLKPDVEQVNRLAFRDVSIDTSGMSAWLLFTEARLGNGPIGEQSYHGAVDASGEEHGQTCLTRVTGWSDTSISTI